MSLRRSIFALTISSLAVVALACGPGDGQASLEDSTLNRDLSLSQQQTQPPALNDAPLAQAPPARPAPARPAARPPASPPVTSPPPAAVEPPVIPLPVPTPATGTIAAGTRFTASIGSRVCSSVKAGDKIVATTSEALIGSNGVSIPAGAVAVLEVESAEAITDSTKGHIRFRVRTIESAGQTYAVVASAEPVADLERTRTTETKSDVKKVAGGAIAGAILGQILGKDTRSTVIGAAAGAAAGTAVAVATGKYEGCVAEKSAVRITLNQSLILPVG